MNAKVLLGSRVLLGVLFLVFGLNGFLTFVFNAGFLPMPPPSEAMMQVMGGFMATKYLMPLVKVLQIISGLLLLFNKCTRVALLFLGPIVINILLIHIFVDLAGLPIALIITIPYLILLMDIKDDAKAFFCK